MINVHEINVAMNIHLSTKNKCFIVNVHPCIISQFGVTIWACADQGHSYQDCEITIDLKYWLSRHASHVMNSHVCTSCILECAWEGILFNKLNEGYLCCFSIEFWEKLHSNASLKNMSMFESQWYMGSFVH